MNKIGKIRSVTIGGVYFDMDPLLYALEQAPMFVSPAFFGHDAACGYCMHESRAIERGFCHRGANHRYEKCGLAWLEKTDD